MAGTTGAVPVGMHPGQLDVTVPTVRALVREQFSRWADLEVAAVRSTGTMNAVFRIGDGLTARFPLVGADPEDVRAALQAEAATTRELFGRTGFPTPEPVALGEPGHGYPLPWSVQTWLPGRTALDEDPAGSEPFARDLARFVAAVARIGTAGRRFCGTYRGGELPAHDERVASYLAALAAPAPADEGDGSTVPAPEVDRLARLWDGLRDLPRTAPDVMTHGDLTAGNVLVREGRLAGVLDCGTAGPADPALDLVAAWHLLDHHPRQVLRDELGCDDVQWRRGAAWALEQALGLASYYGATNPVLASAGRRTLVRLLAADDLQP